MARLNSGTISRRTVEALPVGEQEAVFWDRDLSGFGVRVYPTGSRVYLVQTRHGGRSRRVTIGRHGVVTAEQARRKAAVVIASIKAGEEPGRANTGSPSANGPTIAELGERYLREHVAVRCKPTTAGVYRYTLTKYLLPESRLRACRGDRAGGRGGSSLPSPQDAEHGEPCGGDALAAVLHGGSLGSGAGGREPMPVREEVQEPEL